MNAPASPQSLMQQVADDLLYSGYQHSDTLQFDLYGSMPDADDGYIVEHVYLHGTVDRNESNDLVGLLTGTQVEKLGEWLDFKDDVNPTLRSFAEKAKHEAMRPPFERNRGMY